MNLKLLTEPLNPASIEWRIGQCGKKNDGGVWAKVLAYLTSRAVHDRLDEVCGVENWQMRYKEHHSGTICEIGIHIGDEWIWKAGGSDDTDIEGFKGGLSSAEKRAAVPWGIGRYLYGLTEMWAVTSLQKKDDWKYQAANKSKGIPAFWWQPPQLPNWALPDGMLNSKHDKSQTERPYSPETLKEGFAAKFSKMQGGAVSQDQIGVLVGKYNEILGGDTDRYDVMQYLYGSRSSKGLITAHVLVGLAHLNGDEAMAKKELIAVRDYLRVKQGQKELL